MIMTIFVCFLTSSRHIFLLVDYDIRHTVSYIPYDSDRVVSLFNPFFYPYLVAPNACILFKLQLYSVLKSGKASLAYR
jgi:hypothetical protein